MTRAGKDHASHVSGCSLLPLLHLPLYNFYLNVYTYRTWIGDLCSGRPTFPKVLDT